MRFLSSILPVVALAALVENTGGAPVDASARKAAKAKYGQMGAPITGVAEVYQKVQEHDFGGKQGVSWAILTTDGRLIKATTYNGNLGDRFNLGDHNTTQTPAENTKDRRRALKGYSKVDASTCPIVAVPEVTPQDEGTDAE